MIPDWLTPYAEVDGNGCWLWTRAIQTRGYGSVGVNGRTALAHRWVYERMSGGPIPAGMTIDHLCRVKRCVNPAHLDVVSVSENVRRYVDTVDECPNGHAYTEANTATRRGRRECIICRTGQRRRRDAKRVRAPLAPGDPRHGRLSSYTNRSCRCDACREAGMKYRAGDAA